MKDNTCSCAIAKFIFFSKYDLVSTYFHVPNWVFFHVVSAQINVTKEFQYYVKVEINQVK